MTRQAGNRRDQGEFDHGGTIVLGAPAAHGAKLESNCLCVETRFQLLRPVGEGGMGCVYEATLIGRGGFQKRVAIKTIRPEISGNPRFAEMFVGEAKLVADLIHENIVQIYLLDRVGDAYFVAMEFINGVNLEQFARHHRNQGTPLPVEWAVFIASRVARALEHAHGKCGVDGHPLGIVHRDVSPKNILLRIDGVVKLGDFGIAKAARFMNAPEGVLMGKRRYMSPEQARCGHVDARSDLFSLGVVLHELLTGRQLFDAHAAAACLEQVLAAPIPPPSAVRPDVPANLDAIVMRMLQRDRDQRYADAATIGHDLEYHLYHKGYGPTNQKLAAYLFRCFPGLNADHLLAGAGGTTVVQDSTAETMAAECAPD